MTTRFIIQANSCINHNAYNELEGIKYNTLVIGGDKDKVVDTTSSEEIADRIPGSICFLCSCIFNDSKYAVGAGTGIPALGFIVQMMADAGKELENAKYATFFTLFDSAGIIAGEKSAIWGMLVLFIGAIVLFSTAIVIFSKKDLHI